MDVIMIVLRLIHIFSGVFWAGAVFINEGFLMPTVRAVGPAGAPFMQHLMGARKYPMRIATSGFLVVLSGIGMYWRNGAKSNGVFYSSRQGMILGFGALAAIIGLTLGLTLILPAGNKLTRLGGTIAASGGPPTAEQQATIGALQQRISTVSHAVAGLIAIAVLAMAIGRYV